LITVTLKCNDGSPERTESQLFVHVLVSVPARLGRGLGRTWSTTPAQKQVRRAKSTPHSWTVMLTESREWGSGRAGVRRALWPCIHAGSNDMAFRWLSQLGGI